MLLSEGEDGTVCGWVCPGGFCHCRGAFCHGTWCDLFAHGVFGAMKKDDCLGKFLKMKHVGVSKNRGTPKWMVYNGKPY